jgi:hypothetical protein
MVVGVGSLSAAQRVGDRSYFFVPRVAVGDVKLVADSKSRCLNSKLIVTLRTSKPDQPSKPERLLCKQNPALYHCQPVTWSEYRSDLSVWVVNTKTGATTKVYQKELHKIDPHNKLIRSKGKAVVNVSIKNLGLEPNTPYEITPIFRMHDAYETMKMIKATCSVKIANGVSGALPSQAGSRAGELQPTIKPLKVKPEGRDRYPGVGW